MTIHVHSCKNGVNIADAHRFLHGAPANALYVRARLLAIYDSCRCVKLSDEGWISRECALHPGNAIAELDIKLEER